MSLFMILHFFIDHGCSIFSKYLFCNLKVFIRHTLIIVILIHTGMDFQSSAFLYLIDTIFFEIPKAHCLFFKDPFYQNSQLHFQ